MVQAFSAVYDTYTELWGFCTVIRRLCMTPFFCMHLNMCSDGLLCMAGTGWSNMRCQCLFVCSLVLLAFLVTAVAISPEGSVQGQEGENAAAGSFTAVSCTTNSSETPTSQLAQRRQTITGTPPPLLPQMHTQLWGLRIQLHLVRHTPPSGTLHTSRGAAVTQRRHKSACQNTGAARRCCQYVCANARAVVPSPSSSLSGRFIQSAFAPTSAS